MGKRERGTTQEAVPSRRPHGDAPAGRHDVFQALYDLAVAMAADRGLDETLGLVVERTRDLLGTDTAYIALRDEGRGDVSMHTLAGIRTRAFRALRMPFGSGLGGLVAVTRRGYIVEDYFAEGAIQRVVDDVVAAEGLVSGLAAPLQMGEENLGVLYAFNRRRTAFRPEDLDLLLLIANLAGAEIARKRALEALTRAHDALETRVAERTRELTTANEALTQEIRERRRAEEERQRFEEQLRQAQKMEAVGRLAGGIAHDFNNLLTAILGYCDLLQRRLGGSDPTEKEVRGIRAAAERAASLTHQLLAFSRKQVRKPRVLSLAESVREIRELLGRLLGEDIEIEIRAEPEAGLVEADPGQIHQVLLNLAVNARDAMPRGGTLLIETAGVEIDEAAAALHRGVAPGSYVSLSVTDTGCGMDAATQAHLFEPFFTTKGLGKGTGLGLATVHGIVEQSGGHIRAASEVGKGTTFRVYLPRVAKDAARGGRERQPAPAPGGTEVVLVVEDSAEVRELVCAILRAQGYRVLEASRGEEALAAAGGEPGPIHLLLTDVVMPGLNGRELAERLTAQRPGLKVIYMSGYAQGAVGSRGVPGDGVRFLKKPFRSGDLARKVREALDAG